MNQVFSRYVPPPKPESFHSWFAYPFLDVYPRYWLSPDPPPDWLTWPMFTPTSPFGPDVETLFQGGSAILVAFVVDAHVLIQASLVQYRSWMAVVISRVPEDDSVYLMCLPNGDEVEFLPSSLLERDSGHLRQHLIREIGYATMTEADIERLSRNEARSIHSKSLVVNSYWAHLWGMSRIEARQSLLEILKEEASGLSQEETLSLLKERKPLP